MQRRTLINAVAHVNVRAHNAVVMQPRHIAPAALLSSSILKPDPLYSISIEIPARIENSLLF